MTRRRLWARGAAAVLTAVVVTGCGSDEGAFDAQVADVRSAVEAGDHQAANDALDALAMHALAAHDDGTISEAELAEVSQLIESSRALLGQVVPPPTTTTTTTTTTEPPPPIESEEDEEDEDEDDKDDEEKEDDEKGKGKGRDKD